MLSVVVMWDRTIEDFHLPLEVRLDVVAAVLLDGLSYRRAGRMVGISMTEVGDSMDLLLAALGYCQPDGTFITTLADLGGLLVELAQTGEAVGGGGAGGRAGRGLGPPRGGARRNKGPPHRRPSGFKPPAGGLRALVE